jgi:y4mF family transcriptional regulator
MKINENLQKGNFDAITVGSPAELGDLIRKERKAQQLTQKDVVGLGNTGNRLVVDIENGKTTVQLQKVFDLLGLLGLEMTIKTKAK